MKAVVTHATGGPDMLQFEEVPRPRPEDEQVLVKVALAGVNPIDWKFRRGLIPKALPAILGSDVAGTIESSLSPLFAPGDEVFGVVASGGYAEYAVANPGAIAHKPPGLSDEQAAALPIAGMTAWQALFDAGELQSGQRVLIAGAAGGVGHLAVQFAKLAGVHVLATGSARNRDFVLGLGADEYFDYAAEEVSSSARDVDVAFDCVGSTTTATLLPTLREGAILVTIANEAPTEAAHARGVRATRWVMVPNPEQLAHIGGLVAEGKVAVEIAHVLALTEVRQAHELSESGRTRGKILLRM